MIGSAVDWTNVLVALITGLPAIIAAVGVVLVHKQIRTPSGKSIGKQVEDGLHTTLANNYRLRSIGNAVSAEVSPQAHHESQQVDTLVEGDGEEIGLEPPAKEGQA